MARYRNMKISKWEKTGGYALQSDIVRRALSTPEHSVEELVRLMRQAGQGAVYLAGSRLDHDYCFGSTDIGMLFSVLPEDAEKAAEPGYHPGSTEVYVTFEGSLVVEYLEAGRVCEKTLACGEVIVLPGGQCHRVRHDAERKAASLIVKTNLRHEPAVVRCDACAYYSIKAECPLHQRWRADAGK